MMKQLVSQAKVKTEIAKSMTKEEEFQALCKKTL